MKFWLIIFFLTPEGEFVGKREIQYKDKASCYVAMDHIKIKRPATIAEMVCVSDDHHAGRKQDAGVPMHF
jgi:hypothetical protein